MHIRKRPSSRRDSRGRTVYRYQATWTENGRKHTETFDTREVAEEKLDSCQKAFGARQVTIVFARVGTCTLWYRADQWLKSRHDLKASYRAEVENLLAH